MRSPSILILDEATSQLDPDLEAVLHQAAQAFTTNGILISIAHRLSTIKSAHKIYAMSGGEVVEQGTHQELVDRGGYYANLVQLQSLEEVTA